MSDDDDFDGAGASDSDEDSDLLPSSDEESTSSTLVQKKKKAAKSPVKKTAPKTASKPASTSAAKSPSKVTGKRAPGGESTEQVAKVSRPSSSSAPVTAGVIAPPTAAPSGNDITKGPPVTTEIAAKKLILQYCKQQNRPYSALQVHDNLHKRIPKPTVERVLTSLSADGGGLICKEYGKAKIYFVDQSTLNSSFTQEDLNDLQEGNDELKKQLEEVKHQEKQFQLELNALTNEPSDEELERLISEAEVRIAEKSHRLKLISNNSVSQDPNALDNAIRGFNFFRSAWLNRKQMCMNAVEMISEGMNKKVKDVLSELCMEADADVGAVLPAAMKETVRK